MRSMYGVILLALVCWTAFAASRAFAVSTGNEGVSADAGSLGGLTLSYPEIKVNGKNEKASEVRVENKGKTTLKYPSGTRLVVEIKGDKAVYTFSEYPGGLKDFKMGMMLPFNLSAGGKWAADGGAAGVFPAEKPTKAQFFSNHTRSMTIFNVDDSALKIGFPPFTYVQLQDNREWGWQIYGMTLFVAFNKDNPVFEISFSKDATQAKRVIIEDKFGQNARKDFPGKVKSEEELKGDIKEQEAYFAAFQPQSGLDQYGGLGGSGEKLGLQKTGFFHTEQKNDRWVLVDPAGNAFFQLGICCMGPGEDFTYVEGRESSYEWLPERTGAFAPAWHTDKWWSDKAVSFYIANVIRKYGSWNADENMERNIKRVRQLGFNSNGAWSMVSDKTREMNWAYCPFLPKPAALPGIRGVFDPFNPKNIESIQTSFAKSLPGKADDPLIIGWFIENEQAFEDLPRGLPKLDDKQTCKVKLVDTLAAKYKTIDAFNAAWGTKEASFESAKKNGLAVTTKEAYADMHAFTGEFLEAYYKLIHDTFRQYDKNHLLIGNRWQPGTANDEQLCTIAGKYLDVISVNYYTYAVDKAFIERIRKWTGGKPQLWSEFHYGSGKDSGNPGRVDVGSQKMRGLAYRNYVETAASLGYVLGVQWFVLVDQPLTGRFFQKYNGENYSIGLFSVADRPYKPMVEEMAKTNNGELYKVWLDGAKPFALDDPRFASVSSGKGANKQTTAPRLAGENKIDGQLEGWPNIPPETIGSDRLVLGSDALGSEANFKLSYDDQYLYVFVQVRDETPLNNTATGGSLWNGDGVELFIGHENLDEGGQLKFSDRQILLGAGKDGGKFHYVNMEKQPEAKVAVAPTADGKGYTLEAALPWSSLDIQKPASGMELLFDLGVDNNDGTARQGQLMWNGSGQNSKERGKWGRVILAQ